MSESPVSTNMTASQLADFRNAALVIVGALLADRKYLLLVLSEGESGTPASGSSIVSDDSTFEIRDFPDTDPDSIEAIRPNERMIPVWRNFVRYGIESGLLTLTVVGDAYTRLRLTLNRNVAGGLLTGKS
jgi:hypothetical protein